MSAEREQASRLGLALLCDFSSAFNNPGQRQGRWRAESIQDWGFARWVQKVHRYFLGAQREEGRDRPISKRLICQRLILQIVKRISVM